MQLIKVPQFAWFGPKDFELPMPDDWQVEICRMDGYARPELTAAEISAAIKNPIAGQPLKESASGKKEVAIVFDDLTRVTRAAKMIPAILEELFAAGIKEDNIRFICSLALHGVMNRSDFARKLGEDIVSRFRVYNHNPFGNCMYVGTTSRFQTRVHINEEYMKCDLKIVIGSVVPHPVAGFGGGSKNIMPGLAAFETIDDHHRKGGARIDPVCQSERPKQGMGFMDDNPFRTDIDQAAEMAGIDFLVNSIVSPWGEPVAIYAGNWKESFQAAVRDASAHYKTPTSIDKDIVFANAYAKASESMIALAAAIPLVSRNGGDIVILANTPEGQVTHYLVGPFGKTTFALQYSQCEIPAHVDQVISFSEFPHRGSSWFQDHDRIVYMNRRDDVFNVLRAKHGAGSKVAVIPDATNQYFAWFD